MMMKPYLFTSESVSSGHPDKICDQLSDTLLDAALKEDAQSRVAIECMATHQFVVVGGEMTTSAMMNVPELVRATLKDIGYRTQTDGVDPDLCPIMVAINQQSADIAKGVDPSDDKDLGAGDQGLTFGYACKQTPQMMPLPIMLAHQVLIELESHRREHLSYLKPDAKSQVTIGYDENHQPARLDTIVLSSQHDDKVTIETLRSDIQSFLKKGCLAPYLDDQTRFLINPTGRFVSGGPQADVGLTGRKVIVDTYGGWSRHGGGAFSGKDPTKIDRSAAYMARYLAKNMVAAGLADQVEVQLAYAIGVAKPVSIYMDTFGSARCDQDKIVKAIQDHFDLSVSGIIRYLDLRKPVYAKSATYGHFGRDCFTWEKLDHVSVFQALL